MSLKPVVVTEIITHVRVWTVQACDVLDAVHRVQDRKTLIKRGLTPPRCESNSTVTRWAGAVVEEKK